MRSVAGIDKGWIGFEPLTQDHFERQGLQVALTVAITGRVEAAQHGFQVAMIVDRDSEHLALNAAIEASTMPFVFGV
ncbi:hypothetical protein [Methylobacterium brachythecii]|uniref:Uncharacterized protein n=1 Tax=Methylobacterium brachythecii TaxID=1176177 RepID=A0A7W6F9Z9_9HYPH|nr:hypothetical protein [Methylobacterium brachythecii]MBB3905631.1 hypothetical protein [Methylobacterium brachythecii]